jgi:hypothetical protein
MRGPGKRFSPSDLSGSSALPRNEALAENTKSTGDLYMKVGSMLILGVTLLFGSVVFAPDEHSVEVTVDYS